MTAPNAITTVGRAGLAVAVLAGATLGAHWCRDALVVDSCLDAGHVYDYANERCDSTALTLPVIAYTDRHAAFLRVASALVLSGIAVALASRAFAGGAPELSFSGGMALLIMGLAVWAVPGWGRLVLVAPIIAGTGWALLRLRRSG